MLDAVVGSIIDSIRTSTIISAITPELKITGKKKIILKNVLPTNSFFRSIVMTKETNTPVIITTTLSRLVERRTDKHPLIRDIKYIHLRELSDTIVLLYREAYYSLNEDDDSAEILISKNIKVNPKRTEMRFDHNMIRFTVR